jgi:hypothetical protein
MAAEIGQVAPKVVQIHVGACLVAFPKTPETSVITVSFTYAFFYGFGKKTSKSAYANDTIKSCVF